MDRLTKTKTIRLAEQDEAALLLLTERLRVSEGDVVRLLLSEALRLLPASGPLLRWDAQEQQAQQEVST